MRKIWTLREAGNHDRRFSKIQHWPEYQDCARGRFAGWEFFLEDSVKMLLDDLKNFESVNYFVDKDPDTQGRIGYKDQDGISYKRLYRYKTLFAYFKERSATAGLVNERRLRENIFLIVNCGSFSYAAVPKLYTSVIGVTGTLKTLSEGQVTILEDIYNIKGKTFMPSVYSDRQLVFKHDMPGPESMFKVFKKVDFHDQIRKEIDRRRISADSKLLRPILVFFETNEMLVSFHNCSYLRDIRNEVGTMTEELSPAERAIKISAAVIPGRITLLTREYGRGIDFVPFDENVDKCGGVHVLQTFVSLEISEEVQIKGRTARQGKSGSYSMLLCEEELERLGLSADDLSSFQQGNNGYEFLDKARRKAFNKMYQNAQEFVDSINDSHCESQTFLEHLYNKDVTEVKEFIEERNHSNTTGAAVSYTLCLIDATGSMGNVIEKTKTTVASMFERVHQVLKAENVASADFQLQFAVYRNYGEGTGPLLEHSPWGSEPNDLRAFVSQISCRGGQGNEAVEIGLFHANRVHRQLEDANGEQLNQVILIGDMPPNTPEEVTAKRAPWTSYWPQSDYAEATHAAIELKKLKENDIPVHAFYVHPNAKAAFTQIAEYTNPDDPICEMLDIESTRGAEALTAVVTKSVFDSFSGRLGKAAVTNLKEAYDKMYPEFGYVSS